MKPASTVMAGLVPALWSGTVRAGRDGAGRDSPGGFDGFDGFGGLAGVVGHRAIMPGRAGQDRAGQDRIGPGSRSDPHGPRDTRDDLPLKVGGFREGPNVLLQCLVPASRDGSMQVVGTLRVIENSGGDVDRHTAASVSE